jgi:geranylgeranyl diphosphate synthase type II
MMTPEQTNPEKISNVQEILQRYKNIVWPEIETHLKDLNYPLAFKIQPDYLKDASLYWKTVTEYPERKGKYLRPVLLLLTSKAMGVDLKEGIKTAAAMQLSEDWLLIHDDIEDNSSLRRGLPALHKMYGIGSAINAGDTLHVIMWNCLSENINLLGTKRASRILKEFHLILTRTALGQGVEINWASSEKFNFTDNDWFFIADGKTSYYTIAGPMRLGAIIAGANNRQLENLAVFGQTLGRCFQLVDDLLDATSKEYKGKGQAMGNDIKEGKRTLILSHLLRSANPTDRKKIIKILKKTSEQKTQKEVDWVIGKMLQYGSINYAQTVAKKYRDKAREIFDTKLKFLSREPARSELKELIDFILERKY